MVRSGAVLGASQAVEIPQPAGDRKEGVASTAANQRLPRDPGRPASCARGPASSSEPRAAPLSNGHSGLCRPECM